MGAKGKPKDPGSGRKAGTPNKRTQDLMAKCEARGVDVFDMMLEFLTVPCPMEMRFAAMKEIAQYIYPKRKAIEHSGQIDTNPYIDMPLEELEKLVVQRLKEGKKK